MNTNATINNTVLSFRSTRRRLVALAVVTLLVGSACAGSVESSAGGGDDSVQDTQNQVQNTQNEEASAGGGSFDRDQFVLCPVIEEHKDDLASILGFDADPEKGVLAISRNECSIAGSQPGDSAWVELVAAFVPSLEFYLDGYEGALSPVSELGDDAVFIDSDSQPIVVFLMGDLIINVGAHVRDYETGLSAPPRDVMIAFATRVRELLVEANA